MRHHTSGRLLFLQLFVGMTLATAGNSSAQVSRRAQSLLGQMTLEKKIGQLNLAAGVGLGGFVTAASDTDIIHRRVGAILWLANPKEIDRLQHLAVERSRMHIPQLYIHQRAGSASRPVRQLEGFRRVTLQPGETSTLRFSLRRDELKFWSPRTKRWVVEPTIFDVWAGEDSRADLHTELTIEP